ncbi:MULTISPECIES: hypothetical protein [unclassified Streptomyces]|uniref:hypothetical protein n=1 Tax=unclassified Streptomyces TaxID=2593676 RepID=UPI0036B0ABB6
MLLSALHDWAGDSPTTAVPGIARSIIRFTTSVVPDPDRPDTAGTLEAMRDEHLAPAHALHPAPVRTTVQPGRSTRWSVRPPARLVRGSDAHQPDGGAVQWARVETVATVRFSLTRAEVEEKRAGWMRGGPTPVDDADFHQVYTIGSTPWPASRPRCGPGSCR